MVWKFIDGALTCTLDVWNMTCMVCIDPATIYNITTLNTNWCLAADCPHETKHKFTIVIGMVALKIVHTCGHCIIVR